jgi:L-amino acid N-acyltransferase YncA
MRANIGRVRPASTQDAVACLAIYRPYVEDTAVSWETEVPSVGEMASRITGARDAHEWLVLQRDGQVVGFVYGHALRRLPSFQWSAETGIYADGLYRRVEWKHGRWHDIAWVQLDLVGTTDPDEPPGPIV